MARERAPRKVELVFFRNDAGAEPVRDWLKEMDTAERHAIRTDPVACTMALASRHAAVPPNGERSVGGANRSPCSRPARVLICFYQGRLVARHGFIKKTRATPEDDLALARKRQKELEHE